MELTASVIAPRLAGQAAPRRQLPTQLRAGAVLPQPARFRSACQASVCQAAVTIEKKGEDVWNKSYYPKGVDMSPITRQWVVIDAKGQRLGRMSTLIANYLRGANSPSYHPACDTGAFVIVINAEQVEVTGRKAQQKTYHRVLNGRPGSMKVETFEHLQARLPQRIIEEAVWGMITKERLGRRLFTHLKVYKGPSHPHEAQKPVDVTPLIANNMPAPSA